MIVDVSAVEVVVHGGVSAALIAAGALVARRSPNFRGPALFVLTLGALELVGTLFLAAQRREDPVVAAPADDAYLPDGGLPRALVDAVVTPRTAGGPKLVLVLGDDFSSGAGLTRGAAFPAVAAASLGDGYEVVNASVDGLTALDEVLLYQHWAHAADADVVVLATSIDDLGNLVAPVEQGSGALDARLAPLRPWRPSLPWWWAAITHAQDLREVTDRVVAFDVRSWTGEPADAYTGWVRELATAVRGDGARLVVAYVPLLHSVGADPDPFVDIRGVVEAAAASVSAEYVDLRVAVAGGDEAALQVASYDVHPSAQAHAAFGAALAESIRGLSVSAAGDDAETTPRDPRELVALADVLRDPITSRPDCGRRPGVSVHLAALALARAAEVPEAERQVLTDKARALAKPTDARCLFSREVEIGGGG